MDAAFWWTLFDVEFIVSFLTMIYYSFILFIMLNSSSVVFRSAFFRIFIVTGFFDIQAIVVAEWIRADQRLGFGPNYEIVTRIMFSFTGSHFFTHIFGCFLMTLNRHMAVCHPRSYDKWWSPRAVNIMLLIEILLSFVLHTQLFMIPFGYKWKDGRWYLGGRVEPIPFIRIMSTSVVIIYEVLSIALITATIYTLTKLGKVIKVQRFWQEMGLVVVIAIDCLLGAVDCIYEASDLFGFKNVDNPIIQWINGHYCLLLFLIVSMNSYSIIFMSTDLRRAVMKFYYKTLARCRCYSINTSEKVFAVSTHTPTRIYR